MAKLDRNTPGNINRQLFSKKHFKFTFSAKDVMYAAVMESSG